MPTVLPVENCEKKNVKQDYNQAEVRLLHELVAITEYQKSIQSPKKDNLPKSSFMDFLTKTPVKLINIPDAEQFWLRALVKK